VLFHGEVLQQEIKGKNARAIQAFNDEVARRSNIERLLLPVRDGLMILKKT
jgi:caffeoyl-CoA O-methyltransferase